MHLRRNIALALTGAVLAVPALTSCGFNYATDRVYTPAAGTNNQDASVDVLGAVIVSAQDNSGTFIASFANNSSTEPATVESLEGVDQAQLRADNFSTIEVPAGGLVNLAEEEGIPVSGEFSAGEFVPVTIEFGSGDPIEMDVPVVTNCGDFEGLDGPSSPDQCEAETPPAEH